MATNTSRQNKFDTLFTLHYERLVLFAESYVVYRSTAEDVVQDVFLKLLSRLDFETVEYTRAYLFTTVKNSCIDHLRALKLTDKRNMLLFDAAFQLGEFDVLAQERLISRIEEEITKLPAQRQKILKLSVYEGLSYSEIAVQCNVSVNTVKTHMKKAYQDLREGLYNLKDGLMLLFILSKLENSGKDLKSFTRK